MTKPIFTVNLTNTIHRSQEVSEKLVLITELVKQQGGILVVSCDVLFDAFTGIDIVDYNSPSYATVYGPKIRYFSSFCDVFLLKSKQGMHWGKNENYILKNRYFEYGFLDGQHILVPGSYIRLKLLAHR